MKRILTACLVLTVAWGASAQDTFKKYDMKSCIARTQTTTGGSVTEGTFYMDDYGAFECDIKKMEIPGLVSYDYGVLTRINRVWTFNVQDGKADYKESPNPMPDLNFLGVTDELARKYEMQDLGEDSFMGKPCHKFSYIVIQNRKRVEWTVWAYKGVPLKYVIKQGRRESVVEVVDLQENVPIPDNILHLIEP